MYFVFALFAGFLLGASPALAFVARTGNDIAVAKGETINETLLAAGQNVTVDGDVKGDIICAGQTITISGNVDGDVLCVGQNITVSGVVGGSVRAMGQSVQVIGKVARNVTLAGQALNSGAAIGGEMLFAGQKAAVSGQIAKSVDGAANSIVIDGQIGGDARFQAKNLSFQKNAVVNGSVAYVSENAASTDPSAKIVGTITQSVPPAAPSVSAPVKETSQQTASKKIRGLVINLVVALILVFLFKKSSRKIADALLARPGHAFGWGVLIFIVTPILSIATALTVIGIPVAIIMVLLFIAAIFFSRIFAALAVGRKITQMYWKNKQDSLVWQAIIGVVLMWILFALPAVGWIISAVSVVWGLGGIYYLFRLKTTV